jgi:hypothetical protein
MNTTPGGAADDASAAELPPIAVPEGYVLVQLEAKIGTKTMHDLGMIQDMYTEDTPLQGRWPIFLGLSYHTNGGGQSSPEMP